MLDGYRTLQDANTLWVLVEDGIKILGLPKAVLLEPYSRRTGNNQ